MTLPFETAYNVLMVHLLISIFYLSIVQADPYTLADLEVLSTEEAHQEFFEHALDVRPIERQDAWKGMVIKMGDSFSRKVLEKNQISSNDFKKIEDLFTWPGLKTDDIFRLRRQQIGLRYLKACLKEDGPCWKELTSFWEASKADPDTAYKLAELTMGMQSPISTWTFLDAALKSTLSSFYCQKDFVMSALWGKLEIDYIKLGSEGDLLVKIDQTVHPDCLSHLNNEARKRLYRPIKVSDREIAFQILKSQGKATPEISDFFYTVYLLDNPSQGELFNYSWNRVKELGGTLERREVVLKTLKSLDPLPDSILSSLDQSKKRVVLKHFKTYFPEYLDFYANQCTDFYGGKSNFPTGNPTINCKDFMNSELAPELLDHYKIQRYKSTIKL